MTSEPVTCPCSKLPETMLIRGGLLLTQDTSLGELRADILIQDGKICAVDQKIEVQADRVIDAEDYVILPGFIDTHRHTWQSALRLNNVGMDYQSYIYQFLLPFGAKMAPGDVYTGTLIGAVSAIDAGITTLRDESNIQNSPAHTDAAIQALRDSGIRAVFDYGYPLTEPRQWLVNSSLPHPEDILRLRRDVLNDDDALVTLGMMLRGPGMTTMDIARQDIELMRELNLRGCLHVGETLEYKQNPVIPRLQAANLLGPDLTFIHCCTCEKNELEAIRESGGSVSIPAAIDALMPGLGSPATGRALAAGIRPSLSIDVETVASPDMFGVMRAAWLAQQLNRKLSPVIVENEGEFTARDLISFATIDGAKACGIESKVGSITPGKQADLIMIDIKSINIVPAANFTDAIVSSVHSGNVTDVMINGQFVKRQGKLTQVSTERVIDLAAQSRCRLLGSLAD